MTKKQPAKKKQSVKQPRTRTFWVFTAGLYFNWLEYESTRRRAEAQRRQLISLGRQCGPIVKVEVPLP